MSFEYKKRLLGEIEYYSNMLKKAVDDPNTDLKTINYIEGMIEQKSKEFDLVDKKINAVKSDLGTIKKNPLTAEQILEGLKNSVDKSLPIRYVDGAFRTLTPEELIQLSEESASSIREKRKSLPKEDTNFKPKWKEKLPFPTPESISIPIEEIKLDEERTLRKSFDPKANEFQYEAIKNINEDGIKTPKQISSLKVEPDGRISFIKSSLLGAKEGASDRLMMEATKDGLEPHSTIQTNLGKKFVAKRAMELRDETKSLDKINKFLNTGKLGKLWSAVPLIGTIPSFNEARDKGLSIPMSAGYAAVEEANPLPISPIQYYEGMEESGKGRAENIKQNFEAVDRLKKRLLRKD